MGSTSPRYAAGWLTDISFREMPTTGWGRHRPAQFGRLCLQGLPPGVKIGVRFSAPEDAQRRQVDIDAGRFAESKTQSKDVKAFEQRMIIDHGAVNKAATDLVRKQPDEPKPQAGRRRKSRQPEDAQGQEL